MKIGGLQPSSLLDFPGKVAAIVFTQGCNFRCPFCHNPELVLPELFTDDHSEESVFAFLEKRRGQLDGVSITGGEPTLQPDLIAFVKKVKAMGYAIKLDTNGSAPLVLEKLLKDHLLDYVAMDLKAPFERYMVLTGCDVDVELIRKSIELILAYEVPHIFRTTHVPSLLSNDEIAAIRKLLPENAVYRVQPFKNPDDKELLGTV